MIATLLNYLYFHPVGLYVEAGTKVIYMSELYSKVHIFSYEGRYIGKLEDSVGDSIHPGHIAVRPGMYPPLSTVEPQSEATADDTITLPIYLRGHRNQTIDYTLSDSQ